MLVVDIKMTCVTMRLDPDWTRHAQNARTILDRVGNTIEEACVVTWREEKFHFNLLLLVHHNPSVEIGNDNLCGLA